MGGGADQLGGIGDRRPRSAGGHLRAQAAGGGLLAHAGGLERLDGGGLETAQEVSDRLIDGGDAGDGDRTGDDAHLIGGVARVLGLPQGVGAPPAQDVGVEDRYEGHRLGVLAAQVDEPGGVSGLDAGARGGRVA